MYTPDEIIFVPEAKCNLHCSHCYVDHNGTLAATESAVKFLRDSAENGVSRVGFSGGEPFLRPDFICAIVEAAIESDMLFDRIMTNGVWYKNQEHLESVLNDLCDTGYDGKIGLSYDAYHGQGIKKVARFIETAAEIFGDRSVIELVAVRGTDEEKTIAMYENLAAELSAKLVFSDDGFPISVRFSDMLESGVVYETKEYDSIVIGTIDLAPEQFDDPKFWQDSEWFTEDYCQGPGNVFYVHADGTVGGCCGYSNELDELIIGSVESDSYKSIMEKATRKEMMTLAYETGLSAELKRLQDAGHQFPGITKSNCQFCRYVIDLKRKESQQ